MGIIASLKGMFSDALVGELVTTYGLKRSASSHLIFTGQVQDYPVALEQGYDKKSWDLTAGDLGPHADEEESILLEHFDPAKVEPGFTPDEEIDGVLAVAGPAVTEQYLVGGAPESGDWSVLKRPAVGDILPRFSPAVEVVELFCNRPAVTISLQREKLDRWIFDKDLALAIDLARGLGG